MVYIEKLRTKIKNRMQTPYLYLYGVFLMALLDVVDFAEYSIKAAISLSENWAYKTVVATFLASLLTLINSTYGELFMAYFWIVVIDIWTRWLAIGYQHLIENGANPSMITTKDKFGAIVIAFSEKKITSTYMSWGFITKMTLFGILITASIKADIFLKSINIPLPMTILQFMLAYTAYNELLSIAENLRDAGNAHMDKLVDLLNTNIFTKLKK